MPVVPKHIKHRVAKPLIKSIRGLPDFQIVKNRVIEHSQPAVNKYQRVTYQSALKNLLVVTDVRKDSAKVEIKNPKTGVSHPLGRCYWGLTKEGTYAWSAEQMEHLIRRAFGVPYLPDPVVGKPWWPNKIKNK